MIVVTITQTGLTVEGHAGYAKTGNDIICAAVSALAQGLAKGLAQGQAQGQQQASERYSKLILILDKEKKNDLIIKVASDPDFREELYRKYGI